MGGAGFQKKRPDASRTLEHPLGSSSPSGVQGRGRAPSWRRADGGPRRWGSKNHDLPKFCSGPEPGPKAPSGVKIGATDAEKREESKKYSLIKISITSGALSGVVGRTNAKS